MPSTTALRSTYLEIGLHSSASSEILIDLNVFCQIIALLYHPRIAFNFLRLLQFLEAE